LGEIVLDGGNYCHDFGCTMPKPVPRYLVESRVCSVRPRMAL
jgi:hypothetical protein